MRSVRLAGRSAAGIARQSLQSQTSDVEILEGSSLEERPAAVSPPGKPRRPDQGRTSDLGIEGSDRPSMTPRGRSRPALRAGWGCPKRPSARKATDQSRMRESLRPVDPGALSWSASDHRIPARGHGGCCGQWWFAPAPEAGTLLPQRTSGRASGLSGPKCFSMTSFSSRLEFVIRTPSLAAPLVTKYSSAVSSP